MATYRLFANTGYQIIRTEIKYDAGTAEWSYPLENVRWLMLKCVANKAWLCVDTTTGDPNLLRFAESESQIKVPAAEFTLPGAEDSICIEIHASCHGAGVPIEVAFVLDYGNCRTMGLLVENNGLSGRRLPARPFQLISHNPLADATLAEQVFDSHIEFVRDCLPRDQIVQMVHHPAVYETVTEKGFFKKPKTVMTSKPWDEALAMDPKLFYDISPVRLGGEGAHFRSVIDPNYGALTGMSSPKRYLWADEALNGQFWQQITTEVMSHGLKPETVRGDYFGYVYEDDRDWEQLPPLDAQNRPPTDPAQPAYPRRSLMTMAIYELLCQAFQQINSIEYRLSTDSPMRKRILTDLVMSFPSNMSRAEVDRYQAQIDKAVRIFCDTHTMTDSHGNPASPLRIRMVTDEGTAGQLSYVYSEIQALGSAEQWLQAVGRKQLDGEYKARVACLDIGGGTTDLMIADYSDREPGKFTDMLCEIKCLDGEARAGDDVIQRLLQAIVIPRIANERSIGKIAIRKVFEDTSDGAFSAEKLRWVTEVWIPLARRYLALAEGDDEKSSFRLDDAVDDPDKYLPSIHNRLQTAQGANLGKLHDISFRYNRDEFRKVVHHVLGHTLWRMSQVIASYDCDLLVLSGRTTKLSPVRELLAQFLALPQSRIIPLDHFEAGAWYPIQDPDFPGLIGDPKSAVVVGAAIEYLCTSKHGMNGTRIEIVKQLEKQNAYYWGACIGQGCNQAFSNEQALFGPDTSQQICQFRLVGPRAILGRRRTDSEETCMAPVYGVQVVQDYDAGPIELTLNREIDPISGDEKLTLMSAVGSVGKRLPDGTQTTEPAKVGENVFMKLRTLLDDRYFLDNGDIFGIDYNAIGNP